MVYSVNNGTSCGDTSSSGDSPPSPDYVSAAIMAKVLEERSKERNQRNGSRIQKCATCRSRRQATPYFDQTTQTPNGVITPDDYLTQYQWFTSSGSNGGSSNHARHQQTYPHPQTAVPPPHHPTTVAAYQQNGGLLGTLTGHHTVPCLQPTPASSGYQSSRSESGGVITIGDVRSGSVSSASTASIESLQSASSNGSTGFNAVVGANGNHWPASFAIASSSDGQTRSYRSTTATNNFYSRPANAKKSNETLII